MDRFDVEFCVTRSVNTYNLYVLAIIGAFFQIMAIRNDVELADSLESIFHRDLDGLSFKSRTLLVR